MRLAADAARITTGGTRREGEIAAWRNLLWDSVRMLHVGRPDLAERCSRSAREIEFWLRGAQRSFPNQGHQSKNF